MIYRRFSKFIFRCTFRNYTKYWFKVDSSVSKATRLRARRLGFDSRQAKPFSSPQRPDRLWGSPSPHLAGTGALALGAKWTGYEAILSPLSTLHLLPGLRMRGGKPPRLRLHGVVLSSAPGRSLLFTGLTGSKIQCWTWAWHDRRKNRVEAAEVRI
jgi:hypothetical protein